MSSKYQSSKEVFLNIFWKTGERVFAQGVTFIVSIILARILSPDDYGVVAMLLVFINIADVFVQSGFSTALIQKKDADDLDFSTIFYCSILCSIIIYLFLYVSSPIIASYYNNEALIVLLRIFSLKIPLGVLNSIQHAYVSRNMKFKLFFWSTLIGTVSSGIIGIILAYHGFGVWSLIFQYLLNTIIDSIVLWFTIEWRPKFLFSLNRAKQLMSYGWKILVADLSGTFFGQLRNLIIGKYYLPSELAYYNKGQQLPLLVYNNIGMAIMSVLFPAISNVGDKIESAKRMTRRSMQVISFILFPILIMIAIVATSLIRLLLTNKWDDCIPFVQFLSLGYAFAVLGIAPFQALKAIGKSDVVLKLEFIKKPIFIIFLIIGVKISVLATAITMVLYELYGVFINSIQVKKHLNYNYKEQIEDVYVPILLSIVMSIIMFLCYNGEFSNITNLIIQCTVGIIVYVLIAKIFNVKPYQYIKSFIKK